MACQLHPWEKFSYLSDFEHCWGLKVDKLDRDYMNLQNRMTEDDVNPEVKSACNVLEALPVDPFEMGMKSTLTAVSGWLEGVKGLESNIIDYKTDEGEAETLSDQLFAALHNWEEDEDLGSFGDSDSFFVDDGSYADSLPRNVEELLSYALASICCSVTHQADKASQPAYPDEEDDGMPNSLSPDGSLPENVEELLNHALESLCVFGYHAENSAQTAVRTYTNGEGDGVHDALFFALGYLSVKDLLSVQGVCKSLNDAVKRDSLLWRNICIDAELSTKISDDTLLQLTSRADGTLQSLSLMGCRRISDSGLTRVLESNPGITMLCVPDCTRLTIDGVVSTLKEFMRTAKPGLRRLRIGSFYGVTNKHMEELKAILGSDNHTKQSPRSLKPMFYHMSQRSLPFPDDRVLDIDTCPHCQEAKLVYDCPAESCRSKNYNAEQCRGCRNCIPRCIMCGGCIADCHFTETFCLEYLCLDCVQKPKSRDKKDGNDDLGVKCMIIIQGVHCECCMLG
ncbi:unnamed protein product [Rhodiola kirilowii]